MLRKLGKMKLKLLFGIIMSFSFGAFAQEELVLVENGISQAPIIVFEGAPPYTKQAANELAEYIGKIAGAKPTIIEGCPLPIPKHAIWVGYQPILKELFPKTNFDFKNPEEILISANKNYLVLAGRDRWPSKHLEIETHKRKINGVQQEYGTCNAVYTFLQEYLEVRWFWPGELGEDTIKRKTISFKPFEYRYYPQIRFRNGIFNYSSLKSKPLYGQSKDWVRHQRLQLDSLDVAAGHPFTTWWERYGKTHPEYFALQPNGTRGGSYPAYVKKMCEANPALWEQWLAEVGETLKKNPNETVFSTAENDGWDGGHCVCPNCQAWDHPDGELRRFTWTGEVAKDCVALSDRQLTFANTLARKLKEKYPNKDYYVLMMAYGHSRPAPVKAIPDKNVIVMSVSNFYGWNGAVDSRLSSRKNTYKQQYEDWAKIATQLIWRPNAGSPAGAPQGQPDISLHQTAKDFKFVAEHKCIGIFIDMIWEHWATLGPQYYLMAQLAWDPRQNSNAIMEDYYKRAFGKASDDMNAYWTLLENTREEFVKVRPSNEDTKSKKLDLAPYYEKCYNTEFFKNAYELLQKASTAVANEPEIYRKRIDFVKAGLDYTKLIIEVRSLMSVYKQSGMKDEEAKKQVLANWQSIEKLCKDNPYAINWGPIRPITPRMAGLHPDYMEKTNKNKNADTPKINEAAKKSKDKKTKKNVDNDNAPGFY